MPRFYLCFNPFKSVYIIVLGYFRAIMKLGNDIIEIDRIRQALENQVHLKRRVYTIHEIDYCESRNKGRYESYAGIYAAKEAFIKGFRYRE